MSGRPPHGGRGLKSDDIHRYIALDVSPPSRGAWIEIGWTISISIAHSVAPLTGGVD